MGLLIAERIGSFVHRSTGSYVSLATFVLVFFIYSFLGYVMECVVLSIEKRRMVVNRGFVGRLPFCIIYGFGATIGCALLQPFAANWLILFLFGAMGATCFEYLVAKIQLQMFGSFWWDYSDKPYNFRGILCLESTIGWGVLAILLVRFGHRIVVGWAKAVPPHLASKLAVMLCAVYIIDFIASAYAAARSKRQARAEQAENTPETEFWNNA